MSQAILFLFLTCIAIFFPAIRQRCFPWQFVSFCQLPLTKVKMLSGGGRQKSVCHLHNEQTSQNSLKLLLILNSFVSRTTHQRPYLQERGCGGKSEVKNRCTRENQTRCVSSPCFFSSFLFWRGGGNFWFQTGIMLHSENIKHKANDFLKILSKIFIKSKVSIWRWFITFNYMLWLVWKESSIKSHSLANGEKKQNVMLKKSAMVTSLLTVSLTFCICH